MNAFTIKDLENLSGIKAHTIRIWEQRYAFLKPNRTNTNIRYYSNEELKTLLNVALLNKYGYKISHIDKMKETEMQEKIKSLTLAQAQQERIMNELISYMIDLDIDRFEKTLDEHIRVRGIEKAITQIIFPFLEKIGVLWMTDHINPAQEHLVSNIIRQKLMIGIESTGSVVSVDKTLLLFLPEGEHHELGLLFTYYLLKSRGVRVLYLGANVPLKDLEFVIKLKRPDHVYTHLTSLAHNFNFERFLLRFSSILHDTDAIISGLMTQQYKKEIPAKIQFKRSLNEVMEYIGSLH